MRGSRFFGHVSGGLRSSRATPDRAVVPGFARTALRKASALRPAWRRLRCALRLPVGVARLAPGCESLSLSRPNHHETNSLRHLCRQRLQTSSLTHLNPHPVPGCRFQESHPNQRDKSIPVGPCEVSETGCQAIPLAY